MRRTTLQRNKVEWEKEFLQNFICNYIRICTKRLKYEIGEIILICIKECSNSEIIVNMMKKNIEQLKIQCNILNYKMKEVIEYEKYNTNEIYEIMQYDIKSTEKAYIKTLTNCNIKVERLIEISTDLKVLNKIGENTRN